MWRNPLVEALSSLTVTEKGDGGQCIAKGIEDHPRGDPARRFPDFYWQDFCTLLIKEDLRDLPWSIGVMEYWNDGLRGEKNNKSMPFDFSSQYSSFPLFHHSMWMAPTSPADFAHGQRCSRQN
jgi:hypothetical protein